MQYNFASNSGSVVNWEQDFVFAHEHICTVVCLHLLAGDGIVVKSLGGTSRLSWSLDTEPKVDVSGMEEINQLVVLRPVEWWKFLLLCGHLGCTRASGEL